MLGWTLGAVYSVPPIRTKRNPIAAGLTIATVRGFLLNFGIYYAVKDAISAPFTWSPKVAFIARFMTMFATVIAVTKDLPDIEGDKVRPQFASSHSFETTSTFSNSKLHSTHQAYNIDTFATKIGVPKIAKGATFCLLLNYFQAIVTGLVAPAGTFRNIPMIGGHLALASVLIYRYRQLDPESTPSIKIYYKHIWDLFYLEYGLYTLI